MKRKALKKSCEICQNSISIEEGNLGGRHTPSVADAIEECKKGEEVAKNFGVDYVWEIELDIYDLAKKCHEFKPEYFKKCVNCKEDLNVKKTEIELDKILFFHGTHPCCSKECAEKLEEKAKDKYCF